MISVSVIVCTFNRAKLLKGTIDSLLQQNFSRENFEIIIIDNNSTDETPGLVESFMKKSSNIRYLRERRQGISHARNLGWKNATGRYVGYTDDDCRVLPEWLTLASEIIRDVRPAMFGGPARALYEGEKPRWFKSSYVNRELGDSAVALPLGKYLAGYNMFFRKNVLEELSGFDVQLGMNGRRIAYGEDIAIQMKIRSHFPDEIIYYHPGLCIDHLIRLDKMKLPWLLRSYFSKGRYVYLITKDKKSNSISLGRIWMRTAKVLTHLCVDLTYGVLTRNHERFPYAQNYICEHTSKYLRGLGKLFGQFETLTKNVE